MSIIKSKKVQVLRKELTTSFYMVNMETNHEGKWKIGGAIHARECLSYDEEKFYLPRILDIDPDDKEWGKRVREYWSDISVFVPEKGLVLEIGFEYPDETVADKAENTKATKEEEKYKYGKPINNSDYVLYRHCLKYSKVANTPELANASTKIRFFMYNEEVQEELKYKTLKIKQEAQIKQLEIIADEPMVNNILIMLGESIDLMTPQQRQLSLDTHVSTNPTKFLQIVADKKLGLKSLIQTAINLSILRIIENTSTIIYDENVTVGTDMNEAVVYFESKQPENLKIIQLVKEQLRQAGVKVPAAKDNK